ncbi:MAG: WbuC family cupin fold metalloprotein [Gammaproteobacteria bacterium]|nr:WbuC family cupin fold metalloprotein [Gammaproteobacteria bacterium]
MKMLDRTLLASLHSRALASPRLRTHYNLHASHQESVQRMCMAMEPGTYVRPHRHPNTWELLLIIQGEMLVLGFDEHGSVLARTRLAASGEVAGVESPAGSWHAVASLSPATVVLEVKCGPYLPTFERDYASWAPPEGHANASAFERWYLGVQVSGKPPTLPA